MGLLGFDTGGNRLPLCLHFASLLLSFCLRSARLRFLFINTGGFTLYPTDGDGTPGGGIAILQTRRNLEQVDNLAVAMGCMDGRDTCFGGGTLGEDL